MNIVSKQEQVLLPNLQDIAFIFSYFFKVIILLIEKIQLLLSENVITLLIMVNYQEDPDVKM